MIRKLTDTPIQRKLMSVILMTCAIVVLLMSTAYIIFEYFSFRDTLRIQIKTLASVVALNSAGALAFNVPEEGDEILKALKAEPHIVAAALYDAEGKMFARYPAEISMNNFPDTIAETGFHFRNNSLDGFIPVMQKNSRKGSLYIRSDMEAMYEQLQRYVILALLLFAFSLVVAYLLSKLLHRSISGPILSLEQTARQISEKADYSVRATKSGKDELGALTDAFNHMLTRIESQNHEITGFNHTLEQTIARRTKALATANETLKQQKEFVETIVNSSIDVIAVFDMDLNYVMLNKRADEFYNLNREAIVGRNVLDVFPQMKDSEMIKDLQTALDGTPVTNTKYKSVVLDRYFESYYIPLKDNNGRVYGALNIAHDITNIMESHEKLAAVNTELLKSNRDLEQFAYVASHDLQEPLRKIQVFTQLMGEHFDQPESLKKYHDKISQSAGRMQELIQDVLNFSRTSKTEDAFEKTDLNQVIENLKNDFELAIQETGAQIIHQSLPEVEAIPLQLSQLFYNLISNSLKYSAEKPVIHISTRTMNKDEVTQNLKLNGKHNYTLIQFSDNGIGFEPQYNEQIFTIFQRLHGKQAYSGTGIGLALCRKIVENHQGIITASGEKGKGATFTIILPLEQ